MPVHPSRSSADNFDRSRRSPSEFRLLAYASLQAIGGARFSPDRFSSLCTAGSGLQLSCGAGPPRFSRRSTQGVWFGRMSNVAVHQDDATFDEIGRATCRERGCQNVEISEDAGSLKKK